MDSKVAIIPWGDVIEDYLDPLGIGLETFATGLSGGWLFGYAAALRHTGIESCVICFTRERQMRRFEHPQSGLVSVAVPVPPAFLRLRRLPAFRSGPAGPFLDKLATPRAALVRVLQDEGITIALCQEYEYHRTATILAAGRVAGVKVFATFQGGFPSNLGLERRRRARAIQRMDGLIIASQAEAIRVTGTYGVPPGKIAVIPNPLDLEQWRPTDRASTRRALNYPEEARIVICHTRIDIWRKGLDVMLQAWRQLMAEHPNREWRFHLIGTGSDEEELRNRILADPVPGLRWSSYTADRAAMRQELSAADLYVSASRNEGQAVAPLEAMACGLPVVLSTAPGSDEILPDGEASGGLITPVADIRALQAVLTDLLTDPQRRARMGLAARARVESFAGLQQVGAQLGSALGL